jgi:hypothetical protein
VASNFSSAAVERIAECSEWSGQLGTRSAEDVVKSYLKEGDLGHGFGLPSWPFEIRLDHVVPDFFQFANLLEVGASAGYIDLSECPFKGLLGDALFKFIELERKSASPGDLTLIEALEVRLRGTTALDSTNIDWNAFYGYAAFLALTAKVNRDGYFLMFRMGSVENWQADQDLPFLVSPRHFAQALATGFVDSFKTPEALGGVRALGYIADLCSLKGRLKGVDGLYAKALRCAHWAHPVQIFERRMQLWSERISDWTPADEADKREDAESWRNVLHDLILAMFEEGIGELAMNHMLAVEAPVEVATEDLISQGRFGTARARIRQNLSTNWEAGSSNLAELVHSSIQLADAGAPDEAAIWIDRITSRFGDEFNSFYLTERRDRALKILAEVRLRRSTLEENSNTSTTLTTDIDSRGSRAVFSEKNRESEA